MKKTKWHLLVLLCYSVWAMSMDFFFAPSFHLPIEFIILFQQFWVFYTAYAFLYFLFLAPKRKKLYSIPLLLICVSGSYSFTLLYVFVYNKLYEPVVFTQQQIIFTVTQVTTQFFIPAIGYFFVVKFFMKQEKVKELEQQKLILQKELLQSENNFLRAQINPHFLYNCLNFFYSETFQQRPDVAEAIMLLSQMMRYSLTDFSATRGLANLEDEIEHIQNVVQLNKFRFSDKIPVSLKIEGNTEHKKIVPMLLMTLVENIFKHADLKDAASKAEITCTIDEKEKKLIFTTVNKKNPVIAGVSQGLGISNIRQRLVLLYNSDKGLQTINEGNLFKVQLTIPYFEPEQTLHK